MNLLRNNFLDKDIKVLLAFLYLRLHNVDNAVHRLPQRNLVHVQRQLSTFNF